MRAKRIGSWLAGLVIALCALAVLSARTGGPVSWVVTNGISMSPGITQGTLVFLTRQPHYEVGEVIAYHNSQLKTVVLHRAIDRRGDGFVMKGDHNTWIDTVEPTEADIVGRRLFQIQGFGSAFHRLTRPGPIGALVSLLAVVLAGGSGHRRRRHRRRTALPTSTGGRGTAAGPLAPPRKALPPMPSSRPQPRPATASARRAFASHLTAGLRLPAVAALAAFALLGAITLLPASLLPAASTSVRNAPSATAGVVFSYGASVPPGIAYTDGKVKDGDTVYTRLVPSVDVLATLDIKAPTEYTVSGSWHLETEVANSSGWRHTAHLGRAQAVRGKSGTLKLQLAPAQLMALTDQAAKATGVSGERTVSVRAVGTLLVQGPVGGPIRLGVDTTTAFSLDENTLRPAAAASTATGGSGVAEVALPAPPSDQALTVRGHHLPTHFLRVASVTGGLAALLILGVAVAGTRRDEASQIAHRHKDLLVAVSEAGVPDGHAVVEVESFTALAGLAARYERMVLHAAGLEVHTYLLCEDGVAYRYTASAKAPAPGRPRKPGQPAIPEPPCTLPHQRTPERSDWLVPS
jgi:signal peptidase I